MMLSVLRLPQQRGKQGLREPMMRLGCGIGALGLTLPRTSFIGLGRVPLHLDDQDTIGFSGLDVSAGLPSLGVGDRLDRPAARGQESDATNVAKYVPDAFRGRQLLELSRRSPVLPADRTTTCPAGRRGTRN